MLVWLATTATFLFSKSGRYDSSLEAPTIASSASMIFLLVIYCVFPSKQARIKIIKNEKNFCIHLNK
jgi:hypothetical protein